MNADHLTGAEGTAKGWEYYRRTPFYEIQLKWGDAVSEVCRLKKLIREAQEAKATLPIADAKEKRLWQEVKKAMIAYPDDVALRDKLVEELQKEAA